MCPWRPVSRFDGCCGHVCWWLTDIKTPVLELDQFPSVNLTAVALGLAAGYVLPFLMLALGATRVLGLLTLLVSSMTLVFLFSTCSTPTSGTSRCTSP